MYLVPNVKLDKKAKQEINNVFGITADNRDDLIQGVDAKIVEGGLSKLVGDRDYVEIDLTWFSKECGKVIYHSRTDIPKESVKCNCGEHWFIKYKEDKK